MSEYDKLLVTWQVEVGLKLDPDPWQENVEARLAGIKGRMRGRSPLWAPVRGESRPGNPVTLLESRSQITPLHPVLWYPHNLTK